MIGIRLLPLCAPRRLRGRRCCRGASDRQERLMLTICGRHYENGEPVRIGVEGERIVAVEPAWPPRGAPLALRRARAFRPANQRPWRRLVRKDRHHGRRSDQRPQGALSLRRDAALSDADHKFVRRAGRRICGDSAGVRTGAMGRSAGPRLPSRGAVYQLRRRAPRGTPARARPSTGLGRVPKAAGDFGESDPAGHPGARAARRVRLHSESGLFPEWSSRSVIRRRPAKKSPPRWTPAPGSAPTWAMELTG